MKFARTDNIKLVIPRGAVESVFDECDRYDVDETGGRILGTYGHHANTLTIAVNGIIEPGPNAQRTATYFKQDGIYQERVFRDVEERHPTVEHLGNWHTHHVNGLRHLSGGDIETYRRTVEHRNHNTDFFYALLVVEKKRGKTGLQRYIFKNYVLRRGDPEVYEIPASALTLTDQPLIWPSLSSARDCEENTVQPDGDALRTNRVYDQDFISQFFPKMKPFQSRELGIYWRGPIQLVDGSRLEVIVVEGATGATPKYTVSLREPSESIAESVKVMSTETFTSCRAALLAVERTCNEELYKRLDKKRRRGWMF